MGTKLSRAVIKEKGRRGRRPRRPKNRHAVGNCSRWGVCRQGVFWSRRGGVVLCTVYTCAGVYVRAERGGFLWAVFWGGEKPLSAGRKPGRKRLRGGRGGGWGERPQPITRAGTTTGPPRDTPRDGRTATNARHHATNGPPQTARNTTTRGKSESHAKTTRSNQPTRQATTGERATQPTTRRAHEGTREGPNTRRTTKRKARDTTRDHANQDGETRQNPRRKNGTKEQTH